MGASLWWCDVGLRGIAEEITLQRGRVFEIPRS